MTLPPSDHIIWKLARVVIVGVLFLACAELAYANGLTKADIVPLITILGGLGAFDSVKQMLTKDQPQ